MRYSCLYTLGGRDKADLARFSALFIIFCSSPGILREPPFFARERETFGYLFCTCTPYGSSLEKKEERRRKERKKEERRKKERKKEDDDFPFFQSSFSRLL